MASVLAALLIWLTLSRTMFYEPALSVDPRLASVAQQRAYSIAASGYWSHCVPGSDPCVLAYVGLDATALLPLDGVEGENLVACAGCTTGNLAQVVSRAWIASPHHLANLLSRSYRHVGFGVAVRTGHLTGQTNGGPWLVVVEEFSS